MFNNGGDVHETQFSLNSVTLLSRIQKLCANYSSINLLRPLFVFRFLCRLMGFLRRNIFSTFEQSNADAIQHLDEYRNNSPLKATSRINTLSYEMPIF